jgi:hypothetical protein
MINHNNIIHKLKEYPLITTRSNINYKLSKVINEKIRNRNSLLLNHVNIDSYFKNQYTKNRRKMNGFFLEVLFHSLNYSAKRIHRKRTAYFLDLHKSEINIFNSATNKKFKNRVYKRRLIYFTFSNKVGIDIQRKVLSLRLPNIYTGKGLYKRNDIYHTKKVKKKR